MKKKKDKYVVIKLSPAALLTSPEGDLSIFGNAAHAIAVGEKVGGFAMTVKGAQRFLTALKERQEKKNEEDNGSGEGE